MEKQTALRVVLLVMIGMFIAVAGVSTCTSFDQDGMKVQASSKKVSKNDRKDIRKIYDQFKQAMIDKDMKQLNRLLPTDFTARHIDGRTQTKQEWFDDIANDEMNYYKITSTNYRFTKRSNNRVVLRVDQSINAKIYGQRGTWSILGEMTFQKVDGKWRMV